jgi:hypothetical protein
MGVTILPFNDLAPALRGQAVNDALDELLHEGEGEDAQPKDLDGWAGVVCQPPIFA